MTDDGRRLSDYLSHILDAIDRVERYTAGMNLEAYLGSGLVQDAVVRNLEIIGEASRNIERRYPEYSSKHPEIPFAFAYEMRNALAHGYFSVDQVVVWNTIQGDLPVLKSLVLRRVSGDGETS